MPAKEDDGIGSSRYGPMAMATIEGLACALGIGCVVLVVLRRVENYPLGIASVALYAVVFFRSKLYSDALLQLFFVAANVYGWANWQRARQPDGVVPVGTMTTEARAGWFALWAIATMAWGWGMHRFTDASYPWVDAGIAIASLIAQLLMARRRIENWHVWIAVDIGSIPLYAAKGLVLTMGLYALYLMLSIWGLSDWRRARRLAGPVAA